MQSPLLPVSSALPVWREIASMLFKKDRNKDELYESVNVRQGFPPTNREIKARMLDMLRCARQRSSGCAKILPTLRTLPDPVYSDEQWRMLEALLELLPAAVAELQVVFQTQGKADYVEIALRALRALGTADEPTDLALAFDYRLQHILVDEFQDTSFSQLDLLERLTGGWADGDGRTLFCVGDPMQSIYRFRQAEVGLFIDLQQHGLRNLRLEPLRLEANFRSTPAIVDWVNESFPAVLAARSDAEQGAVQYSPSTATVADTRRRRAGSHVRQRRRRHRGGARRLDRSRHAGTDPPTDASRFSSPRALTWMRSHASSTTAGVDFQAIEIEQLRDRPVVQDLIALTRALVHVADRTAWLAVLRAPWCGLTLADLHALAGAVGDDDRGGHRARARLDARRSVRRRTAVRRWARAAVADLARSSALRWRERGRWPLRIWIERTWNALGGPATLTRVDDLDDAEAYLARLEQIETVADLDDVARLEEQLFRLFANARFAGAARVEVMTIHAAKGLEFDTVIVPGLQRYLPQLQSRAAALDARRRAAGRHGAGAGEARRRRSRSDLSLDRAAGATSRAARACTLAVRRRHARETRAAPARQRHGEGTRRPPGRRRAAARLDAANAVGRGGDDVLGNRAVRTDARRVQAGAAAEAATSADRMAAAAYAAGDTGARRRCRRHRGRAAGVRLGVAGEPPRRHARSSRARSPVPARHAGIARSAAAGAGTIDWPSSRSSACRRIAARLPASA